MAWGLDAPIQELIQMMERSSKFMGSLKKIGHNGDTLAKTL